MKDSPQHRHIRAKLALLLSFEERRPNAES